MKKILSLALALVFTFNISTFAAEGDIVDVAVEAGSFTVLAAALTEANLITTLQSDGPFTVFAPTDAAFTQLLTELNITAEDLLAHPDLASVLLYHVVSGKVMSTDLVDGMMPETINGETITVVLSDGVKINDASVVTADIAAINGVIHIIDKVLVPASFSLDTSDEAENDIVDIALSDPQFSMLVMLLQKVDLVGALQQDGPYTVFAPTNSAFESLLASLDITPAELMAQPDLANVLLYHVVSGKVMSTDLTNGLSAATLQGEAITFDLSSGVKVNASNVVVADIEASNGVIHVVDQVLVPTAFTLETVTMEAEEIPKTSDNTLVPLGVLIGLIVLSGGYLTKKRLSYDLK